MWRGGAGLGVGGRPKAIQPGPFWTRRNARPHILVATLHRPLPLTPLTVPEPGRIEVITGVMFSGKTDELMRRVRRSVIARRKVQLFKSHLDSRYGGIEVVSTHDGHALKAVPVASARQIAERMRSETDVVAVDEAQFLDPEVVDVATALAERGVRVILAGTDTDFRGDPFGPMATLMAVAEQVDKLTAVCVRCGRAATRNQRLIDGSPAPAESPVLLVGGVEAYEARCRRCHQVPGIHRHQLILEMPAEP